jgi:hypothetical protein
MSSIEILRDLYNKGQGRRELFDMLATYTNRRTELLVERAMDSTGLGYETVVKILRELEHHGIGKFKLGRKGGQTRLVWYYSPRSVGEAAQGVSAELDAYNGDDSVDVGRPRLPPDQPHAAPPPDSHSLIAQAKRDLAAKMRISPDQITITVNLIG